MVSLEITSQLESQVLMYAVFALLLDATTCTIFSVSSAL